MFVFLLSRLYLTLLSMFRLVNFFMEEDEKQSYKSLLAFYLSKKIQITLKSSERTSFTFTDQQYANIRTHSLKECLRILLCMLN